MNTLRNLRYYFAIRPGRLTKVFKDVAVLTFFFLMIFISLETMNRLDSSRFYQQQAQKAISLQEKSELMLVNCMNGGRFIDTEHKTIYVCRQIEEFSL